jgi:hypothetical protein
VKSEFTLAFLEDTGWYKPNYEVADKLTFGEGMGCSFVEERCVNRQRPYNCDSDLGASDEDCTHDERKKGKCNIRTWPSPLDSFYQYYSDATRGGSDDLADYCGFIRYTSSFQSDCTISAYGGRTVDNFRFENFGEVYCPTCRCIRATDSSGTRGPSCHNMTCVNGFPKVKIGSIWYDCRAAGERITITNGFDGSYECPTPVDKWCSEVPNYSSWPRFLSIAPEKGTIGTLVTIEVEDLNTQELSVTIGLEYGCDGSTTTIEQSGSTTTISCQVGKLPSAKTLRGSTIVDIVITDDQGRTAVGEQSFILSSASLLSVSSLSLFLSLLFML